MPVFESDNFDNHERLVFCQDAPTGLNAIIAGAANNQLATEADGKLLADRQILYAPDYVINAGGVINLAYEYLHLGNEQDAMKQISKIGPRLTRIFHLAGEESRSTNEIADRMAQQRLARIYT